MQQWKICCTPVAIHRMSHTSVGVRGIWGVLIPNRSRILLMFVRFVVVPSPWSLTLVTSQQPVWDWLWCKAHCPQQCICHSPLWWATGSDLFLKVNVVLQPWRSLKTFACHENCGAIGKQISHVFWNAHDNYTDKHVEGRYPVLVNLQRHSFLV